MDSSLKQRLLGAAVLIALAVIFIPMMMSGSGPKPPAETTTRDLAIPPPPDREFQRQVLPVNPAPRPAEPAPARDPDSLPPTATARPNAIPPPSAIPRPVEPVVAAKPADTPAAKPAEKPAETTPKPVPGVAANGAFLVGLGVYADAKNAADLVAELKKAGHAAFAEAIDYQGKPAQRVRVGPFETRAAAESARLAIKQLKPTVPGSVVQNATDAKTDAPATALPANRAGGWAVQLGALKTQADANLLRERVRNAGFAAYVDQVQSGGATLWRVRAGPEPDRAAADRLRGSIKDKMKLDGMLVTQ